MRVPKPFTYNGRVVSALDAALMVEENGKNCHDFRVNRRHKSPSVDDLRRKLTDLDLKPEDGEAYLMYLALKKALKSAEKGRYGVGAILTSVQDDTRQVIHSAMNERVKGGTQEFIGHAETQLVCKSRKYLQNTEINHSSDIVAVNLCPCPGCLGLMIDAHFPTTIIGSIDPETGAAFLRNRDLKIALGKPRKQVMKDLRLLYRFPNIADEELRREILTLSWDIFHTTRKKVHKSVHGGSLKE